jgi:hypothetical protein
MGGMNTTGKSHAFGDTAEVVDPTNEDGSVNATEEEQLQYDMIVSRAIKMIHGKGQDNILKTLGSSETPSQGIGQVTAQLITALSQSAKEGGMKISDDVLQNAGMEIIEELSELAENKGVYQYDSPEEEKQELADSALWAMRHYEQQRLQSGEVGPEEQDRMKADIQKEMASEQGESAPEGIVSGQVMSNATV